MYYAIHTPDIERAKDFYHAVFGWTFRSDNHIEGSSPAGGLGEGEPGIEIYFEVPDAAAMAEKARELGGTATEPVRSKSGWSHRDRRRTRRHAPAVAARRRVRRGRTEMRGRRSLLLRPDGRERRREAVPRRPARLELTPGSHPGGSNIVNTRPVGGMFVHHAAPPDPNFQVMDIDAALAKIRPPAGWRGSGSRTRPAGTRAARTTRVSPSVSVRCARTELLGFLQRLGSGEESAVGDGRLEIDGISKRYGDVVALRDTTFDVRAGELFGFVGSNGAGKTTTMRIALGVLAADAGEVRWDGQAGHAGDSPAHRLHAGGARPLPEDEGGGATRLPRASARTVHEGRDKRPWRSGPSGSGSRTGAATTCRT